MTRDLEESALRVTREIALSLLEAGCHVDWAKVHRIHDVVATRFRADGAMTEEDYSRREGVRYQSARKNGKKRRAQGRTRA